LQPASLAYEHSGIKRAGCSGAGGTGCCVVRGAVECVGDGVGVGVALADVVEVLTGVSEVVGAEAVVSGTGDAVVRAGVELSVAHDISPERHASEKSSSSYTRSPQPLRSAPVRKTPATFADLRLRKPPVAG
jgi:hypothetical protein